MADQQPQQNPKSKPSKASNRPSDFRARITDDGRIVEEGERVIYVPDHAKGNTKHEDVERGEVIDINNASNLVFVLMDGGEQPCACNVKNIIREKDEKSDGVQKPGPTGQGNNPSQGAIQGGTPANLDKPPVS